MKKLLAFIVCLTVIAAGAALAANAVAESTGPDTPPAHGPEEGSGTSTAAPAKDASPAAATGPAAAPEVPEPLFLGPGDCSCTTNQQCNQVCFDGGTCMGGFCACNTPTPSCGGPGGPGGGGGDECTDNEDCSTVCFDGGTCMIEEGDNWCACW